MHIAEVPGLNRITSQPKEHETLEIVEERYDCKTGIYLFRRAVATN